MHRPQHHKLPGPDGRVAGDGQHALPGIFCSVGAAGGGQSAHGGKQRSPPAVDDPAADAAPGGIEPREGRLLEQPLHAPAIPQPAGDRAGRPATALGRRPGRIGRGLVEGSLELIGRLQGAAHALVIQRVGDCQSAEGAAGKLAQVEPRQPTPKLEHLAPATGGQLAKLLAVSRLGGDPRQILLDRRDGRCATGGRGAGQEHPQVLRVELRPHPQALHENRPPHAVDLAHGHGVRVALAQAGPLGHGRLEHLADNPPDQADSLERQQHAEAEQLQREDQHPPARQVPLVERHRVDGPLLLRAPVKRIRSEHAVDVVAAVGPQHLGHRLAVAAAHVLLDGWIGGEKVDRREVVALERPAPESLLLRGRVLRTERLHVDPRRQFRRKIEPVDGFAQPPAQPAHVADHQLVVGRLEAADRQRVGVVVDHQLGRLLRQRTGDEIEPEVRSPHRGSGVGQVEPRQPLALAPAIGQPRLAERDQGQVSQQLRGGLGVAAVERRAVEVVVPKQLHGRPGLFRLAGRGARAAGCRAARVGVGRRGAFGQLQLRDDHAAAQHGVLPLGQPPFELLGGRDELGLGHAAVEVRRLAGNPAEPNPQAHRDQAQHAQHHQRRPDEFPERFREVLQRLEREQVGQVQHRQEGGAEEDQPPGRPSGPLDHGLADRIDQLRGGHRAVQIGHPVDTVHQPLEQHADAVGHARRRLVGAPQAPGRDQVPHQRKAANAHHVERPAPARDAAGQPATDAVGDPRRRGHQQARNDPVQRNLPRRVRLLRGRRRHQAALRRVQHGRQVVDAGLDQAPARCFGQQREDFRGPIVEPLPQRRHRPPVTRLLHPDRRPLEQHQVAVHQRAQLPHQPVGRPEGETHQPKQADGGPGDPQPAGHARQTQVPKRPQQNETLARLGHRRGVHGVQADEPERNRRQQPRDPVAPEVEPPPLGQPQAQ